MSEDQVPKSEQQTAAPKAFGRKRKGARTIYEVVISAVIEGVIGAFAGAVIAALLFAIVKNVGPSMVRTLGPAAGSPIRWMMHQQHLGPIGWASRLAVWGAIIGAAVGVMNAWSDRGRFCKNN